MRNRLAVVTLCACSAVFGAGRSCASEVGRVPLLVDRYVRDCTLHMALPANWTLKAEKKDGVCEVTADEPAHPARCGDDSAQDDEAQDKKVLCQPDHQIVIDIYRGSIDEAATSDALEDSAFKYEAGVWRVQGALGSSHDAILLKRSKRKVLYSLQATRDMFNDGTYCCVGRNWSALADLPSHRLAVIEFSWDAISWDDDTTGWDDATDAAAKNNVEQFLRALK
jgi:hypothetical protein